MHLARDISLWHLLVEDARPSSHPLNITSAQSASVAETVAMFDGAVENVSDRFDAAMRVPRETADVVIGMIAAEIIEHQKRVKLARIMETKGTVQTNACTFHVRCRTTGFEGGSDGHDVSPLSKK